MYLLYIEVTTVFSTKGLRLPNSVALKLLLRYSTFNVENLWYN